MVNVPDGKLSRNEIKAYLDAHLEVRDKILGRNTFGTLFAEGDSNMDGWLDAQVSYRVSPKPTRLTEHGSM